MNHANELNKFIDLAARRHASTETTYRSFEEERQEQLAQALKAANLFFTCSVLGMEAISHVIEDQAYSLGGKFRFYSAFQKFSRFRPQIERYQKLCTLNNPIYIFGEPDAAVPTNPNLHPVNLIPARNLEEVSLSNNWFVILDSPDFVSMALVARELPGNSRVASPSTKLVYRNFEGFWTYEKSTIVQIVEVLDDYNRQTKVANRSRA